jgi:hypothetical protein
MRASPRLENVSIFWVGLGMIILLLSLLLRRKTLLDILTAIFLCLPLVAVGVMSQSKLVIVWRCIIIIIIIIIILFQLFSFFSGVPFLF